MLTPPDIADETIAECLRDGYGLEAARISFLPLGADGNSAVYRIDAVRPGDPSGGAAYFLKLRSGDFDAAAVAVPAFLRAQGIGQVMAPIAGSAGQLWLRAHGFDWMLYPFVTGRDGFAVALSAAQWRSLGAGLRAIHAATPGLPADLAARLPRETYGPRIRDSVIAFDHRIETALPDDPLCRRLAEIWRPRREEIQTLVERAGRLAAAMRDREAEFVLCHTDLHGGNVLAEDGGAIAIVDWDNPLLAPKERDLMFIGNGIGRGWDDPAATAWFYEGYGPAPVDPVALAYYRYERIAADLAAFCEQILGIQGGVEDREESLGYLRGQFAPGDVIEIAHATYQTLT